MNVANRQELWTSSEVPMGDQWQWLCAGLDWRITPMDPKGQSLEYKVYHSLYPRMRAKNPSLQPLFDKYRHLWMGNGVKEVDVDQPVPCHGGDTLLHYVASHSGVDEVDLLAAAGADLNARGEMGQTPLHHAAIWGTLGVAERLLALGADQGLRDEFEKTAQEWAQSKGRGDMARLLRRAVKNHWPGVRADEPTLTRCRSWEAQRDGP